MPASARTDGCGWSPKPPAAAGSSGRCPGTYAGRRESRAQRAPLVRQALQELLAQAASTVHPDRLAQPGQRESAAPRGPKGDPGTTIDALESLNGIACLAGGRNGTVELTYDASAHAVFTCSATTSDAVIRVNEFSTGTTVTATDEFVELFSAGTTTVAVGGYKLVYRSGSGTSDVALGTIPDGTTLTPGAFYLFGGSGYAGAKAPDQTFSPALAGTAGGIGIRDGSGKLLDSVGYGTATNAYVEAHAAAAPPSTAPPGSSDIRLPDGVDTDDNTADFRVTPAPTPGAANATG